MFDGSVYTSVYVALPHFPSIVDGLTLKVRKDIPLSAIGEGNVGWFVVA